MRKSTRSKIDWKQATDIKLRIKFLVKKIDLDWVDTSRVYCVRSENANTRAIARIWGLSRIWQQTLDIKPAYVLEVVSEKFDRLSDFEQDKVLLHELAHIPKNFSGSLVPHTRGRKGSFHDKLHQFITAYKKVK